LNNQYPNPNEWVVVLGSGASINDLPDDLKQWANKTVARIGINKYGTFYEKAGIMPSDIYFHDFHDKTSEYFFYETLNKTKKVASRFYVSATSKDLITQSLIYYIYSYSIFRILKMKSILIKLSRNLIKPIRKKWHNSLVFFLSNSFRKKPLLLKKNSEIDVVDVYYLWDNDNKWASNLNQKLYHFRGSLTSVLNLVSVKYSELNVLMLGVDLISKQYFFDDELQILFKKTGLGYDWTQSFMVNSGKHYSASIDSGVTIFDRFSYVVENLNKSGNQLFAYPNKNVIIFDGKVKDFI
jgi:hypothetical protein